MSATTLLLLAFMLGAMSFAYGRMKAFKVARANGGMKTMHSLPSHYGMMVAMWCALPALAIIVGWKLFEPVIVSNMLDSAIPPAVMQSGPKSVELYKNDIGNLVDSEVIADIADEGKRIAAQRLSGLQSISALALTVLALCVAIAGAALALKRITPHTAARHTVERVVRVFLLGCASIAILTTLGIVLSVLFESLRFFQQVNFIDFITGTKWSPPKAIYLAEYASRSVRNVVKPLLEILAGIPTVVYGFFAALTVAPALRDLGASIGLSVASESALAAGAVMGIMIIPFVSSLSDDVITAVPQAMRDGSYALGATKSETVRQVVIPAALPGIVGGILLAVSRAIGAQPLRCKL